MVHKFKPEIKTTWHRYDPEPDTRAVMVESAQGTYVKLETYLDETKRLRAMIHRLEDRNIALEEDIKLAESNQLQLLEMLKP